MDARGKGELISVFESKTREGKDGCAWRGRTDIVIGE